MRDNPNRRIAERYPFSLELQTRFIDLDVNRHINNVAMARAYEETRVRFHAHLRRQSEALKGVRFLVAHVAIDYLAEGHYPAPLDMRLAVMHLGGSSYRVGMAAFQDTGCVGLCDTVLVHRGTDGPAPMPQGFRDVLAGWSFRE